MSQENQSSLRFSLEESLWFRKGQEVAELVSISLDPDITIQENDQYVTIRGSLELTGEYKSFDQSGADGDQSPSVQKYVQSVEERDEGIFEFSHRFPVDITIPNNRIQSIYDIDVIVESFDYALPERSCLKLSAELMISGLYGAQQNETADEAQNFEVLNRAAEEPANEDLENEETTNEDLENEEPVNEEAEENPVWAERNEDSSPLFEVEARKQPEEESYAETVNYPIFSYQAANEESTQREEELQPQLRNEGPHYQVTPAPEEETELKVEHVEVEIEEEENITAVHESSSTSSHEESPPKKDLKQVIMEKITKKKSMSLTEFLARKAGEGEEQVKLKVCIVQKGDTLDRLAERYQVTIQNLQRVNQLEINQDVQEGQVLYIPNALAKK